MRRLTGVTTPPSESSSSSADSGVGSRAVAVVWGTGGGGIVSLPLSPTPVDAERSLPGLPVIARWLGGGVGREYGGAVVDSSAQSVRVTLCRNDEPSVAGRRSLPLRAGANAASISDDRRPVCAERLKPTSLARMLISLECSNAAVARSWMVRSPPAYAGEVDGPRRSSSSLWSMSSIG